MKHGEQRPFDSPLARKFAGVALLIVLPLWALDTFFLVASIQQLRAETNQQVLRLADSTADRLDAWVRTQESILAILTHMPSVEHGTSLDALAQLQDAIEPHPAMLGIAMLDSQAQVRLYTGVPYGSPVPSGLLPPEAVRAARERRSMVSGFLQASKGRPPAAVFVAPLPPEAETEGSLALFYRLENLGDYLDHLVLPKDSVVLVLDKQGTVVYRNVEVEKYLEVGTPLRWAELGASQQGIFEGKGLDGQERLYGFRVAPVSGWTVLVGEPEAIFLQLRLRLLLLPLLVDLLAILGTLILVGILARRFTQPAVELRDVAQRLGAGQFDVRASNLPKDELGELGRVLNLMAEQLQDFRQNLEAQVAARTQELQTANQDLGAANSQLALANSQLSGTVDELRRLDQQRAEFLNMVSHDLRIPLTALLGYTEFLEDGYVGDLNPQQLEYIHQMTAAIERMKKPLDTLLDLARIEAGQLKLSLQPVDLEALVAETVESLQGLLTKKQQALSIEVPRDLPLVQADPTRIEHVLSNLISNASKFTPAHGHLQIVSERLDDQVRISVIDNGVGISIEDQKHLFERFFRAKATDHLPGTGLGLSISKGIILAHGGTIGVVSEPGNGSTFWFELPIAHESDVEKV